MNSLGLDMADENLCDTPARVTRFWREFLEYDPGKTDTLFSTIVTDQLVILRNVRVYSLCAHHLLPFHVDLTMAYITHDHVIGLSKLARIAHQHAHKPQIQERLVDDIAKHISAICATEDVAVLGRGVHYCMLMRGIKTEGEMITNVMRGVFRNAASSARDELMASLSYS